MHKGCSKNNHHDCSKLTEASVLVNQSILCLCLLGCMFSLLPRLWWKRRDFKIWCNFSTSMFTESRVSYYQCKQKWFHSGKHASRAKMMSPGGMLRTLVSLLAKNINKAEDVITQVSKNIDFSLKFWREKFVELILLKLCHFVCLSPFYDCLIHRDQCLHIKRAWVRYNIGWLLHIFAFLDFHGTQNCYLVFI
jgi:hypothetical protein